MKFKKLIIKEEKQIGDVILEEGDIIYIKEDLALDINKIANTLALGLHDISKKYNKDTYDQDIIKKIIKASFGSKIYKDLGL